MQPVHARWSLFAALLTSLSLSSAGTTHAQPAPDAPTFGERVDVRVVEVDVVVTDPHGKPVGGLGLDDFVLEVDGKARAIDYFSEIQDGWVTSSAGATEKPASAPPEQTGPQVPTVKPTNYLVFIDQQFLRIARDLALVLDKVEEQLEQMRPGDRMAVVSFNGRRLSLLSDWSGSRADLREVLAEATRKRLKGNQVATEIAAQDRIVDDAEDTEAQIADILGEAPGEVFTPSTCNSIERLENALERLVQGASAALRGMRPPRSGRKVALLLSGGWPRSAYDYFLGDQPFDNNACPRGKEGDVYEPLWQTANLLGYTLYTIDVPLEPTDPDAGPRAAAMDTQRRADLRATLYNLAEETGGRAFIAGDRERALSQTVQDTSSYYSLGFTPKWRGDDKEHRIEVKVLGDGLKVRHRKNYVDISDDTRVSYLTEGALLLGNLPDALPMGVQVGKPAKGHGAMVVPLRLLIPLDSVTFVPQKHGVKAELELRVAVVDEKGNRNQLYAVPVVLGGDEPPPPGAHAAYDTKVQLRRQPHDLVLTLYQPLTQVVHASRIHIDLGN